MRFTIPLVAAAILLASSSVALRSPSAVAAEEASASPGGIQWFATWVQAKAEAKQTGRPLLLIAAAPHCRNISGMW